MGNVFISYARSDQKMALELYEVLEKQGFPLWLDVKNLLPGQDWKVEIEKAIRESDIFIACLSNNSVNKKGFVQAELKKALEVAETMPEGDIFLIPVRLEDCSVPSSLTKFHWVDYFERENREKLLQAIRFRLKKEKPSINQGVQIATLFISYSRADSNFVDKLGNYLEKKRIRFWRDIQDLKVGRLEKQMDRAFLPNSKVLLVLSEHLTTNEWVEHEVTRAVILENERKDVLFPIVLDQKWQNSPLQQDVMQQIMKYDIFDFTTWEDDDVFDHLVENLLDKLDLFYKSN